MKSSRIHLSGQRKYRGFGYVEVLIATLLITLSLIPAMEALQTGITGSDIYINSIVNRYRLTSRLETVLAEPFSALDNAATAAGNYTVESSYSDPVATDERILVYLSNYDADNVDADNNPFTGVDADLIWIRVLIENSNDQLESLSSR